MIAADGDYALDSASVDTRMTGAAIDISDLCLEAYGQADIECALLYVPTTHDVRHFTHETAASALYGRARRPMPDRRHATFTPTSRFATTGGCGRTRAASLRFHLLTSAPERPDYTQLS